MEELVANLKLAMADRIRTNSWMAPSTKEAALAKLDKMDVMVGYPDKWRNYSGLTLDPADLYGNVERSAAFEYRSEERRVGKSVSVRVDLGGRRIIKKKKKMNTPIN